MEKEKLMRYGWRGRESKVLQEVLSAVRVGPKNSVSNNCVLFRKKIFLPAFAKIYLVSIVSESQIYCLLFVCLRICVVIKCKTKTTIKHLENENFAYFIRNFIWTFHMIPPLDWCLCHLFSAQLTRNFG